MTEFEYKMISIDSKETKRPEKTLSDKLYHCSRNVAYYKSQHTVIILGGQND